MCASPSSGATPRLKADPAKVWAECERNFNEAFSVIRSVPETIKELERARQDTSYIFITQNIRYAAVYLIRGMQAVEKWLEARRASSFGMLDFYMRCSEDPADMSIGYRNQMQTLADDVESFYERMVASVGRLLPSYIVAYETLEKFGLRPPPPFILFQRECFSNSDLYDAALPWVKEAVGLPDIPLVAFGYHGRYSGDVFVPLLIGHEVFHVICAREHLFDRLCNANASLKNWDHQKRAKYEESLLDVMCAYYYGPAYAFALGRYFMRRYPKPGPSHPEMPVRLLTQEILTETYRLLGPEKERKRVRSTLTSAREYMESRSDPQKVAEDVRNIGLLLTAGMTEYVEEYFKEKKVLPYADFLEEWEKQESLERLDSAKLRGMLRMGIPCAVRPTILFNALSELELERKTVGIDRRVLSESVKKWYARRYYEKLKELKLFSVVLRVATSPKFHIDGEELVRLFGGKVQLHTKRTRHLLPPTYEEFILKFSEEVLLPTFIGVFSNWLYEKLKEQKQPTGLPAITLGYPALNGQPIQDKETIERILRTISERQPE
jgi:hypothetical protein